jgi:hypothetical protein
VFTIPDVSGDVVVIARPVTTLMVAVPLAIPDTLELAVICAVPAPTPVTVTVAVFWLCGIVTLGGTVATLVASEVSVTITPPTGADPERVSVRLDVFPAPTVTVCGEKVRFAATDTGWVAST